SAMVTFVDVRVRCGELGHGSVEALAGAEVRSHPDGVAGSRVRAGERPAAGSGVGTQPARRHRLQVDRDLPVPELANVVVGRRSVELVIGANPAEEDLAPG